MLVQLVTLRLIPIKPGVGTNQSRMPLLLPLSKEQVKGKTIRIQVVSGKPPSPSWHFFGLTGPDRGMFSASKHHILGSVMA